MKLERSLSHISFWSTFLIHPISVDFADVLRREYLWYKKFPDTSFLEEDKTVILPPSTRKSDQYSPCSCKNKTMGELRYSAAVANLRFLFSRLHGLCWSDFCLEGGKMTVLSSSKNGNLEIFVSQKFAMLGTCKVDQRFINFKHWSTLQTSVVLNFCDMKITRQQSFKGR